MDEDGCEHSVRMTPFNYIEKKILSKMETDKMIHTKIALMKQTNRNSPRWMKDERIPGMLYFNDTVNRIVGVGKIAKQWLNKNGIMTVGDLHELHSDQRLIVKIARRTKGLLVTSITQLLENIKDLSHEDAPPIVYY